MTASEIVRRQNLLDLLTADYELLIAICRRHAVAERNGYSISPDVPTCYMACGAARAASSLRLNLGLEIDPQLEALLQKFHSNHTHA